MIAVAHPGTADLSNVVRPSNAERADDVVTRTPGERQGFGVAVEMLVRSCEYQPPPCSSGDRLSGGREVEVLARLDDLAEGTGRLPQHVHTPA